MTWVFGRYFPRWGPLLLRIALGTVLMAHGWEKLVGPLGTHDGFDIQAWGWPYPEFWVWVVALVETLGGLCIVVGLFTRLAAALIACVMVMAIVKVRLQQGFVGGFEFEFSLLAMALALVVAGPGRLSVDLDILGFGQTARDPAEHHDGGSEETG